MMTEGNPANNDAAPAPAWFYAHEGASRGPATEPQMKTLIELGHLRPEALVWRDGLESWTPAAATALERFFPAETRAPLTAYRIEGEERPAMASAQQRPERGRGVLRVFGIFLRGTFHALHFALTIVILLFLGFLIQMSTNHPDASLAEILGIVGK